MKDEVLLWILDLRNSFQYQSVLQETNYDSSFYKNYDYDEKKNLRAEVFKKDNCQKFTHCVPQDIPSCAINKFDDKCTLFTGVCTMYQHNCAGTGGK